VTSSINSSAFERWAEGVLASVAGGWQGSEEVAERAVAYKRTTGRKTPDLA
jgi:hypothetical protein